MSTIEEYMQACRLCLVRDKVNVPIFEEKSDVQQIYLRITTCLPVMVSQDDSLPKKICTECLNKLNMLYEFRNTSINAEKQLMQWLSTLEADIKFRDLVSAISVHSTDELKSETLILKEEESDNISGDNSDPDTNFESSFCRSDSKNPLNGGMQVGTAGNFDTQPQKRIVGFLQPQIESGGFQQPQIIIGRLQQPQTQVAFVAGPQNCWQSSLQPAVSVNRVRAPVGRVQVACRGNQGTCNTKTITTGEDFRLNSTNGTKPTTFLNVPDTGIMSLNVSNQLDPLTRSTTLSRTLVAPAVYKSKFGVYFYLPTGPRGQKTTTANLCANSAVNARASKGTAKVQSKNTCPICQKEFLNARRVRYHRMREHTKKTIPCDQCDKLFQSKALANAHKRVVHIRDFKHECDLCLKKFRNSKELRIHKNVHVKLHPFKCTQVPCIRAFSTQNELQEHVRVQHEGVRYICFPCNKSLTNRSYFIQHMNQHNPESSSKVFRCKNCPEEFATRGYLRSHERAHHGSGYICDTCGKKLSTAVSLRNHTLLHTGERPFVCETCGKKFVKKSLLKQHVLVHTKEKPHTCPECGRRFSQVTPMRLHLRLHTGERPYSCLICKKKFVSRSALKLHSKVHGTALADIKVARSN